MVLHDLGKKLSTALRSLNEASVVDDKVFDALLKEIGNALMSSDVNMTQVIELRKKIKKVVNLKEVAGGLSRRKLIEETVISELKNLLDPGKPAWRPKKGKDNTIMFVGLQGSGKTTSCSKLAFYYKNKGFKVGMICADCYRAGAYAQLLQNAAKAKVKFYGNQESSDPVEIAMEGITKFREMGLDLIIVDTSGRHKQEEALFAEMRAVYDAVEPDETIFVMDASIGQAAYPQAKAFQDSVDVGSVILTKLDGAAKGGGALSAIAATESPITFIGTGEHMNELEVFDADGFIQRILGRGNIKELAKKINEADIKDNQEELLEKIKQGKLTLRDMRDQFQNVLKLGPVGTIMQLIPGFSNLGKEHGDKSQQRIQRFLTIMDSMTNEELDGDIKLLRDEKRVRRIAQGAGCSPQYLNELKEMYKPFEAAAKKLKNMKLKNGQMPTNPADIASMFDPRMLKQLGGIQGVKQLMSKIQSGQMDPTQMQQMMQGMGNTGMGRKVKMMKRRR